MALDEARHRYFRPFWLLPAASSVAVLAMSSKTTKASACSFHSDDILWLRLSSSSSVLTRATQRNQANQSSRHIGAQTLLFEKSGIVRVGFGHGEHEIEKAHGHDLAVFRIGHAHEHANRFFHSAQFAFLGGDLLGSDGRRLK